MLESVLRIGSSIRSPAAFARRVLCSTRLDSLLGANKTTHSFTPITTDCLLINVPFGTTIIRFKRDLVPRVELIAHFKVIGGAVLGRLTAALGAENNYQINRVYMMDDYEKYEKACKKIRKDNENLLKEFEVWLKSSGLSDKTVNNHLSNIDLYVNEYLLYEDATEAKDGAYAIGMFLGYWFIKKAMWASQSSIKSNATSLKKFYTFMHEKNFIDKEDLLNLKETIKDDMPEWLATLKRYDDPSVEDVWQY